MSGTDGRGHRVLVVDDERQIVVAISAILRAAGYEVVSASSAREALEAAALRPPDAVILDLILPDGDGVEVCRSLREWSDVPIIVVSAREDESAKIDALDVGADDYVTKPYATGELLARLRAALRRASVPPGESLVIRFSGVEVDLEHRLVTRSGAPVHLTPREYELLAALARHPGRVLTHGMLLRAVWGPRYNDETHYLRVYMANLRRKLEADPADPRHLLTVTGVGYRLQPD